jgi:hypothetical protein
MMGPFFGRLATAALPAVASLVLAACVSDSPLAQPPVPDSGTPDASADVAADQAIPDAAPCSAGLELCGTTCVDLASNPANCGKCGHDCGDGATCVKNACTAATIASPVDHPVGVTASGAGVFWLRGSRTTKLGALETCPIVGCTPAKRKQINSDFDIYVSPNSPTGATLLTDGVYLQWQAQYSLANANTQVFHCPIVGCDHLSTGIAQNPNNAVQMAIGGKSGAYKLVYRIDLGSARVCPFGTCNDSNQVNYQLPSDQNPATIAADDTRLYFDDPFKATILSCVIGTTCTGSGSTALFGGFAKFLAVAGNLLVAVTNTGTLLACDKGGCGGQPTTLATNQPGITAMVADANAVYYAIGGTPGSADGEIRTCALPACTGGPKTLASGLAFPDSLALSGGSLFWANGGTTGGNAVPGSIQRLTL